MERPIVVTRPVGQDELVNQLRCIANHVVHMPLFNIVATNDSTLTLTPNVLIFTSPNAVVHSKAWHESWLSEKGLAIYAIGGATKKHLEAHGFSDIKSPKEQFTSEALLALPSLQALKAQRVCLVKGVGGRKLLGQTLKDRGAEVTELACYQRELVPVDLEVLAGVAAKNSIIVVSSAEALKYLAQLLCKVLGGPMQGTEQAFSLVVSSQRMVQKANEFGFKNCFLASNATTQGLVAGVKCAIEQS